MSSWRLGPYRAVGHTFVIDGVGADVVRARLTHGLAPLADDNAEPTMVYTITDAGSDSNARYTVSADDRVLANSNSTSTAAGLVIWHVNQWLVRVDRGRHLVLHAAGVRRSGVTVVLPAPMESGKTTTCAGLLRAGFEYVTDEALVLSRSDGTLTAFPKSLSLDQGSRRALGDTVPNPPYPNADTDDQWQVPWWELGSPGVADGGRIDAVILPTYRHRSETRLEEVGPGEALLALADSTFEFRKRPRANLDLLAGIAETCPVLRLHIGDLGEAVALVESLVNSLAPVALAHGRSA